MKKVFLVLLLLLLCGCTSNYNLKISNNKFEEKINIVIPDYDYSYEEVIDPESGVAVEDDNQLKAFLEEETPALFSKKANYKKKVNYSGNSVDVNMSYTYTEKNFSDSNSLKLCFDNAYFKNDKTYYIHASGNFYCLYTDSMDIVITTKNKVVSNNADKVEGNNYIWTITEENKDNVNIEFEVEKGFSRFNIIYVVFFAIVIFGIIFVVKTISNKGAKNNEI